MNGKYIASVKILLVAVFVLASVSNAYGQKVKVTFDRSTDFSQFKTYTWDQAVMTLAVGPQIMQSVNAAMIAKGFQKVENDADLIITALAATESDLMTTTPRAVPGLNPITHGIPMGSQSLPVTKGTLLIDILENKTKDSVWRGTATKTLDHGPTGDRARDAKNVERPINNAVEKMFKQFPPKTKH
jgi:hypothetical protein